MSEKNKNGLMIILGAIFCNALFGTAVPMIKVGYELFGITDNMFEKILFAGVRFFVSGILVWLMSAFKCKGFPKVQKEMTPFILLHGFIYTFLQYACMYVGLSFTSGTKTTIISATSAFVYDLPAGVVAQYDANGTKIINKDGKFSGKLTADITIKEEIPILVGREITY